MPSSTADDEFEPVKPFPAACSADDEPGFVVDDADPLSTTDELEPVEPFPLALSSDGDFSSTRLMWFFAR